MGVRVICNSEIFEKIYQIFALFNDASPNTLLIPLPNHFSCYKGLIVSLFQSLWFYLSLLQIMLENCASPESNNLEYY